MTPSRPFPTREGSASVVSRQNRVLIAGGGHAGLLTAALLARAGLEVVVIEADDLGAVGAAPFDGRALALLYGSRLHLERLGVWTRLEPDTWPVFSTRVRDTASGTEVLYDAHEVGDHPFAYGIENRRLRAALLDEVESLPSVEIVAPATVSGVSRTARTITVVLDDGRQIEGGLVIGADGRGSKLRSLAGIGLDRWSYRQTAITLAIRHEDPGSQPVVELLRPAGPLATLPIGQGLSSITWVESTPVATALLAQGDEALQVALEERLQDAIGPFRIEGRPSGYPLSAQHARRYVAPRLALVADAAHGIHPIHAQGFNLGIRDIVALAETIAAAHVDGRDPGESAALLAYERQRRSDVRAVIGLTDGLNRLFSNDFLPARLARQVGLEMLGRVAPLRRAAVRHGMGLAAVRHGVGVKALASGV